MADTIENYAPVAPMPATVRPSDFTLADIGPEPGILETILTSPEFLSLIIAAILVALYFAYMATRDACHDAYKAMRDRWPRIKGEKINIRIAFVIYAVVGAVIGVVVGYLAEHNSSSFSYWIKHFDGNGVFWWAAVGAISSAAIAYARKLLS